MMMAYFYMLPKNQRPQRYWFFVFYEQINSLSQTVFQTAQLPYLCAQRLKPHLDL